MHDAAVSDSLINIAYALHRPSVGLFVGQLKIADQSSQLAVKHNSCTAYRIGLHIHDAQITSTMNTLRALFIVDD